MKCGRCDGLIAVQVVSGVDQFVCTECGKPYPLMSASIQRVRRPVVEKVRPAPDQPGWWAKLVAMVRGSCRT